MADAPRQATAVSSREGTSLRARPKRSKLAAVAGREPVGRSSPSASVSALRASG
jgi:hypothetical protein